MIALRPLLLALVAVVVAACGGGDASSVGSGPLPKGEYEERFREIVASVEEAPEPKGDGADQMEEGLRRAAAMADDLEAIEPPAEIARAHDDFVAGVRAVATSEHYRRVIAAMRDGEEQAVEALADRPPVSEGVLARLARARSDFARKGYELGDITELAMGG